MSESGLFFVGEFQLAYVRDFGLLPTRNDSRKPPIRGGMYVAGLFWKQLSMAAWNLSIRAVTHA